MNEALDAILNTSESAKGRDLGDGPGDNLARGIALFDGCPRVNLSALDGQGDFLFVFIDTEDLDFHLLADLEHLAGMIDAAPGQLTDVHQSICPSQVDKSAKVGEIADDATAYLAGFQLIEEFLAPALPPFLLGQALGENQ